VCASCFFIFYFCRFGFVCAIFLFYLCVCMCARLVFHVLFVLICSVLCVCAILFYFIYVCMSVSGPRVLIFSFVLFAVVLICLCYFTLFYLCVCVCVCVSVCECLAVLTGLGVAVVGFLTLGVAALGGGGVARSTRESRQPPPQPFCLAHPQFVPCPPVPGALLRSNGGP
jgi:hypothetical protein